MAQRQRAGLPIGVMRHGKAKREREREREGRIVLDISKVLQAHAALRKPGSWGAVDRSIRRHPSKGDGFDKEGHTQMLVHRETKLTQ